MPVYMRKALFNTSALQRRFFNNSQAASKHGKRLIYLVHSTAFFALLKLTDKTKTKTTSNCKFFLCEPCMLAFSFDELSDCIIHTTILHPIGYKIKAYTHNYTRLGIKSTTRTIQSILGKVIL